MDIAKYPSTIPLVVAACALVWSGLVNEHVTSPYLDEVFHVGQAQTYCAGDLQKWDPMITTPPGLYLLSYGISQITGKCDINILRTLNVVCLSLVTLESFNILRILWGYLNIYPDAKDEKSQASISLYLAHTAINVSLFPVLFFFSGLYYTDVASVLFVLISIHLALLQLEQREQNLPLAAGQVVAGLAAMMFRQTNVFWVAVFPAGLTVLKKLFPEMRFWALYDEKSDLPDDIWESYLLLIGRIVQATVGDIFGTITATLQYIILILAFAAFIVWNGGYVVLGDKDNHEPTIHLMQIMYLWPAIFFFSWPIVLKSIAGKSISELWAERPRLQLLVGNTFLTTVLINFFTIIHPFTLADNRHYVFYVFRYINMNWANMYLATPVYLATSWLLFYTYMQNWLASADSNKGSTTSQERMHHNAILFVWIGTCGLTLFGASLVEPRYFIIPWIIWRVLVAVPLRREEETKKGSGKMTSVMQKPVLADHMWLALETVWYLAINVAIGYVFLYRTFEWPQEPGLKQRFMW